MLSLAVPKLSGMDRVPQLHSSQRSSLGPVAAADIPNCPGLAPVIMGPSGQCAGIENCPGLAPVIMGPSGREMPLDRHGCFDAQLKREILDDFEPLDRHVASAQLMREVRRFA